MSCWVAGLLCAPPSGAIPASRRSPQQPSNLATQQPSNLATQKMHIHLLRTDTTSLKVDALVYPEEAPSELNDGRAVVTTGGNLLCRFVIHVKVSRADEPDADAKLRASTIAALERAEELAIASVGLPSLGGAFGFTTERCARMMLSATMDFRNRARSLQRAVFCLLGADEYAVFERALQELDR